MRKYLGFILINLGFTFAAYSSECKLLFCGDTVTMNYDNSIAIKCKAKANEESIVEFYNTMQTTNYKSLIDAFVKIKNEKQLNDWFLYRLVTLFTNHVFEAKNDNYKKAFIWFTMNKLGFDCNIEFSIDNTISLYAYSNQKKSGVWYNTKGKKYLNIDINPTANTKSAYTLKFSPNFASKREFSFSIDTLPKLKNNKLITRKIVYSHDKKLKDTLEVIVNKSIVDMLKDYPLLTGDEYFKYGFSAESLESLRAHFTKKLNGKSKVDAIKYILAFTGTGLEYKLDEDPKGFGKNKPQIAEEILFYHYGDCEDLSALFFGLVKEFVGVPMIVLNYPNHTNVAVLLENVYGKPYVYKGKSYTVCESTVATSNPELGYSVSYDKYPNPKVIFEWLPNDSIK